MIFPVSIDPMATSPPLVSSSMSKVFSHLCSFCCESVSRCELGCHDAAVSPTTVLSHPADFLSSLFSSSCLADPKSLSWSISAYFCSWIGMGFQAVLKIHSPLRIGFVGFVMDFFSWTDLTSLPWWNLNELTILAFRDAFLNWFECYFNWDLSIRAVSMSLLLLSGFRTVQWPFLA